MVIYILFGCFKYIFKKEYIQLLTATWIKVQGVNKVGLLIASLLPINKTIIV